MPWFVVTVFTDHPRRIRGVYTGETLDEIALRVREDDEILAMARRKAAAAARHGTDDLVAVSPLGETVPCRAAELSLLGAGEVAEPHLVKVK